MGGGLLLLWLSAESSPLRVLTVRSGAQITEEILRHFEELLQKKVFIASQSGSAVAVCVPLWLI